jgi:hypothetical protein
VQHEEDAADRRSGLDEDDALVECELAADVEELRDEVLVDSGRAL